MRNLFVGTSGWAYPTWKPAFYPPGLPARNFLRHYSSVLTAVEVNYTFRTLPEPATVAEWLAGTPPEFRFAFKAPQRITHFSRLRDAGGHLQQFLTALQPVAAAGQLGPLLFQLPPNFKADLSLLAEFLGEPGLNGSAAPNVAFEFRHASWFEQPILDRLGDLLASRNAALCVAHAGDDAEDLVVPDLHPARTHTCFRLRRSGGYTAKELKQFAGRFCKLAESREVYVALRHEDEPTGALNAVELLRYARAHSA